MDVEQAVNRATIAEVAPKIEPFIRRTPVVRVKGEDFGLAPLRLDVKLELLQHSG